ncbi:MAG: type II toxin-antitoxin system RelE/ParE family toxin [Planctomycetota bacterium]
MAGKRAVRYLPVALDDLISIFDWIADDSPANADKFIRKLDQQILNLKNHPSLGRMPRDEKLKIAGYRVLIIESYLVFYMVRDKTVEIHRIIHGSRYLDNIL